MEGVQVERDQSTSTWIECEEAAGIDWRASESNVMDNEQRRSVVGWEGMG